MTDRLFSDIPVGGGNFQHKVDQMCREINRENVSVVEEVVEETKTEEKKVEEDDTLSKLTS
jgi:hypothetical protein